MLAVLLLTSYVMSGLVIAKKDTSSTSGGTGGSSSGSLGNTNVNDPQHPGKEDTKDISDIPSENGPGVHFIHPINPNPNVCHFGSCLPHHIPPLHHHHNTVVIVKHTSSSSSSSHSLSNQCFNEIKIAWLGKIQRGDFKKVDSIIDKCLGIN